jgi:hypothetical protein
MSTSFLHAVFARPSGVLVPDAQKVTIRKLCLFRLLSQGRWAIPLKKLNSQLSDFIAGRGRSWAKRRHHFGLDWVGLSASRGRCLVTFDNSPSGRHPGIASNP